jgi:hypothetical protein
MHLDASGRTLDGQVLHNKIRFFEINRDTLRWESRISIDDQQTC